MWTKEGVRLHGLLWYSPIEYHHGATITAAVVLDAKAIEDAVDGREVHTVQHEAAPILLSYHALVRNGAVPFEAQPSHREIGPIPIVFYIYDLLVLGGDDGDFPALRGVQRPVRAVHDDGRVVQLVSLARSREENRSRAAGIRPARKHAIEVGRRLGTVHYVGRVGAIRRRADPGEGRPSQERAKAKGEERCRPHGGWCVCANDRRRRTSRGPVWAGSV